MSHRTPQNFDVILRNVYNTIDILSQKAQKRNNTFAVSRSLWVLDYVILGVPQYRSATRNSNTKMEHIGLSRIVFSDNISEREFRYWCIRGTNEGFPVVFFLEVYLTRNIKSRHLEKFPFLYCTDCIVRVKLISRLNLHNARRPNIKCWFCFISQSARGK